MVDQKTKGKEIMVAPSRPERRRKVVDLMAALKPRRAICAAG